MNRKGFTLVELLAVLVILSAIMFIVIPSLGASMNRAKGKKIEAKKRLLVSAAEMYVSDHKHKINTLFKSVNSCYIGLDYLDQYVTDDTKKDDDGNEFTGVVQYNKDNSYNYVDSGDIDSSIPYCDDYGNFRNFVKGDYVSYTPSLKSYSTDTTKTGYESVDVINPSELNLWRVLSINGDGKLELVSEYVSSNPVHFNGMVGYKNLIGYLNVLASKYTNDEYTVGSRYLGYNGQTEYITDDFYILGRRHDRVGTFPPWLCDTYDSKILDNYTSCLSGMSKPADYEEYGGGDTGYIEDLDKIHEINSDRYNSERGDMSLVARSAAGHQDTRDYWLAGRYYRYIFQRNSSLKWHFRERHVSKDGKEARASGMVIYATNGDNGKEGNGEANITENSYGFALRPIVILKSDFKCSLGKGVESKIDQPCNIVSE